MKPKEFMTVEKPNKICENKKPSQKLGWFYLLTCYGKNLENIVSKAYIIQTADLCITKAIDIVLVQQIGRSEFDSGIDL